MESVSGKIFVGTTWFLISVMLYAVSVDTVQADSVARCEIQFEDVNDKEKFIWQGSRKIANGMDRFDVFDSCRRQADLESVKRENQKVISVKAYFL